MKQPQAKVLKSDFLADSTSSSWASEEWVISHDKMCLVIFVWVDKTNSMIEENFFF